MKSALFIILILVLAATTSCLGHVRVKHHWGFMGPDTWEATDGKISVHYYNGNCCCIAEKVLHEVARRANEGELDWSKMADPKFRDSILKTICEEFRMKQ